MNLWAREQKIHVCHFFILSAGSFFEDNLDTWNDISYTNLWPFNGVWKLMSEMSLLKLIPCLFALLGEKEQVI